MRIIKTTEYATILELCYTAKQPLFIQGGPGVGKSEIPRQVFSEIAKRDKLEFVEWDKCSNEKKANLFVNPDKYFVFCDQRLSQMDTTDLGGLPMPSEAKDRLLKIPQAWIVYFCDQKSNGVIFFDEINLAPPVVTGSAYQIILDRSMSDMKLSDNVYVMAAGNRSEDQAFTHQMPLPLRDRFNEIEIRPDKKSWVSWASKNGVNPHLIAFINWKESYLYKVDQNASNKSVTPRGIVRASHLLGDLNFLGSVSNTKKARLYLDISVGEGFSQEFMAYIKYYKKLKWDTIYKNPKEALAKLERNEIFAVTGGLIEHYMGTKYSTDQIINVIKYLGSEFSIMTLRMIKDTDEAKFMKVALKNKTFISEITDDIKKYLL
jgi:hypothetical protein